MRPSNKHCDYNNQAENWVRNEKKTLSDFCARPYLINRILDGVEELSLDRDVRILDAGCGEGYVSRQLAKIEGFKLIGIDSSEAMIDLARKQEKENPLGIRYFVDDIKRLENIKDNSIDIHFSSLSAHYLKTNELE